LSALSAKVSQGIRVADKGEKSETEIQKSVFEKSELELTSLIINKPEKSEKIRQIFIIIFFFIIFLLLISHLVIKITCFCIKFIYNTVIFVLLEVFWNVVNISIF
jgi:hypothetical protein